MMNTIKKYLGLVWIIIAIGAIILLIKTALENIQADGKLEINQPMPWIIIISIFTPIAIGMALFGYYAFKDEYKLDD